MDDCIHCSVAAWLSCFADVNPALMVRSTQPRKPESEARRVRIRLDLSEGVGPAAGSVNSGAEEARAEEGTATRPLRPEGTATRPLSPVTPASEEEGTGARPLHASAATEGTATRPSSPPPAAAASSSTEVPAEPGFTIRSAYHVDCWLVVVVSDDQ